MPPARFEIRVLAPADIALMKAMLASFGEAFEAVEAYTGTTPSAGYLQRLLGSDYFLALGVRG